MALLNETEHIGSGVFATVDSDYVKLETKRGEHIHIIYLDAYLLESLLEFAKQHGFDLGGI